MLIECSECKRTLRHAAKGRCFACYQRYRREDVVKNRAHMQRLKSLGSKFATLKQRCKNALIPLTLDLESYAELLRQGCYYCGSNLFEFYGHSMDRVDGTKGYELANVRPCCPTCNNARRQSFTDAEWKHAMRAIQELRSKNQ